MLTPRPYHVQSAGPSNEKEDDEDAIPGAEEDSEQPATASGKQRKGAAKSPAKVSTATNTANGGEQPKKRKRRTRAELEELDRLGSAFSQPFNSLWHDKN